MTPRVYICRCTLFVTIAALCLIPAWRSAAGTNTKAVARYKVSSRGFSIGDVTTTQSMTEEGGVTSLSFDSRTTVKASFLWMGYHLDTLEKGLFQKGELVSYSRKGRENGGMIDVEGRLERSAFRFEVHEQGPARSIVIPRNSYDYTTMDCPEARLDFSGKQQVTLRILDVEKMAVVKREYHLVGTSQYSVAGKEYPCRIVDYSDQNKKARRWTAWDGSVVVVLRQDGTGDNDSYSVKAVSVNREI